MNQQIILESLAIELSRNFEFENKPGKVYMNIAKATESEESVIQKIFGNNGFINMIKEKNGMFM